MMLLKVFQRDGRIRLPVHCTMKMSLVGAYQVSRKPGVPPMLVATMPEMMIGGALVESQMEIHFDRRS